MYYLIYCQDYADSAERRKAARPEHLKRLGLLKQTHKILAAGPMLAEDLDLSMSHGVKGSALIVDFENLEAAKAWVADDPYVINKVYQNVTVQPFLKVLPEEE